MGLREKDVADDTRKRAIVRSLVQRGMRAQLRTGNLLTGQLYVALDFFPKAPLPSDPDLNASATGTSHNTRDIRRAASQAWRHCYQDRQSAVRPDRPGRAHRDGVDEQDACQRGQARGAGQWRRGAAGHGSAAGCATHARQRQWRVSARRVAAAGHPSHDARTYTHGRLAARVDRLSRAASRGASCEARGKRNNETSRRNGCRWLSQLWP